MAFAVISNIFLQMTHDNLKCVTISKNVHPGIVTIPFQTYVSFNKLAIQIDTNQTNSLLITQYSGRTSFSSLHFSQTHFLANTIFPQMKEGQG